MASSMDDAVTSSDGDVKYRDWAIALGVTTAVFLVTTLLLACVLFVVVCRKIVRLRKEREARVTGVLEGMMIQWLIKLLESWPGMADLACMC